MFELNAPIAPNRAIPIVFLGYENFYPNFFWIDGRKFLIQNMFVARLERQIKKKNRAQSQHRQNIVLPDPEHSLPMGSERLQYQLANSP